MKQNKKNNSFSYYFKKVKFFLEGGAIALNTSPQLRHCILTVFLENFVVIDL